jgi:hypothetical protein
MASVHDGDSDFIRNHLHLRVGIRWHGQLVDGDRPFRVVPWPLAALLDPILALHRVSGSTLIAFLELGSSGATGRE